ncbi:MAG TPA: hypothetical protein VIV14_13020 [Gammaproteobacteria bacterium]
MTELSDNDLQERIDAIESAYEFMLAYAAQGRNTDAGSGSGASELRTYLDAMDKALDGLGDRIREIATARDANSAASAVAFLDAVDEDARRARGIVKLVLGRDGISSQLIDNVNGSIHLRALLTDLFVLDEALRN